MSTPRKPLHLAGMTEVQTRVTFHIIRIGARGSSSEPDTVMRTYGRIIEHLEQHGFGTLAAYVMAYRREYILGYSTVQARETLIARCGSARLWRQVLLPSYKRGR